MNDALRAAIDPVILALLDQQPDHGYSLMLRIRTTMAVDLSDGSLYPALFRLEKAGRIEGTWESPPGERRRKVFHLTDDGREVLRKARSSWPDLAERLGRLLAPTRPVTESGSR
jgi:DNA-binding PadR family transcriptional regulator